MSHIAWNMRICRAYRVDGESRYRFIVYRHDTIDGVGIAHRLKTRSLPPILPLKPPDQCDVWTRVLLRPSRLDASPFMSLVALFIARSSFMRCESTVTSGLLVATRHMLPEETRYSAQGSFVRTAYAVSESTDRVQHVADKHVAAVRAIKESGRSCDTLVERGYILRCHYVFNKWMLDRIERDDGRVLRLHRGGHRVTLPYILNIQMPLELKMIDEGDGVWTIMATPLWLTLRNIDGT